MNNKELRGKYDQMHSQGSSAWFSDGREERETILEMGKPWDNLNVIEIGCGEGLLAQLMTEKGAVVLGIDYSKEAINAACDNFYEVAEFRCVDYRTVKRHQEGFHRIVLQGILEHLDDPFTELKWMVDNLLVSGGDVITSSPCFLNPRGIVWMTLDMLGAVMSKTDLHYLDHHDFYRFCVKHNYQFSVQHCDMSWGSCEDMINDLTQRIPLALKDGKIPYEQAKLEKFLKWLAHTSVISPLGATAVYKIQT